MKKIKILDISNTKFITEPVACSYFQNRINEYVQIEDKIKSYYSYILLKELLNTKKIDLDKQDIIRSTSGKPEFVNKNLNLHFSISHSKNFVVVALSNKPIGIDIQALSKYNIKVAKRFFSPSENQSIKKTINKEQVFTKLWSKYESDLKLFGSLKELKSNTKKIYHKHKKLKDCNNYDYYLYISYQ